MKITLISTILVVVATCTAAAPPPVAPPSAAANATDPKLTQGSAILYYMGDKCEGALWKVSVTGPDDGIPCIQQGCFSGAKHTCVSGDGNDYAEFVKKQFKDASILLRRQYSSSKVEDSACTGKPRQVHGKLADGTCRHGETVVINKDRSVSTKFFKNADCTGSVVVGETKTATETSGQCTQGVRIKALGKSSSASVVAAPTVASVVPAVPKPSSVPAPKPSSVPATPAATTASPPQPPQGRAILSYEGSTCDGIPFKVAVDSPKDGQPCVPRACLNGIKHECVSGNGDAYGEFVKKQFKNLPLNMPVMLYRQYSTIGVENTQCKGKPWHVHGTTADGLCHKNTITTINKNRSISMRQFTNDGCTGEVWNNVTLTAAQMSGNCIDGTRIKALGSRTLRG